MVFNFCRGKEIIKYDFVIFERKRFSKAEVSEKHSLTSPASEKEEIRDYASYFAFLVVFFLFLSLIFEDIGPIYRTQMYQMF